MKLYETVAAFTDFVEAYAYAKKLNEGHPHRVLPGADGFAVQRLVVLEPAYLAFRDKLLSGVGA